MTSQFAFLQPEFPEVYEPAHRAEMLARTDARAACFYARRSLEIAVTWAYSNDSSLTLPYRDELSSLIHEASFRNLVGHTVFQKCRIVKDLGNSAAHERTRLSLDDSSGAVRELFHICYWLVRTYARGEKPAPGIAFDPNALPPHSGIPKQTLAQLKQLYDELVSHREKLFAALADKEALDAKIKQLQAEVAEAKRANAATPDSHNYNEAQTRDLFIDRMLREAGWPLDKPEDREYEVQGMPNAQNKGYVDYVLWGNDGKPIGLVEAKRTRRDPGEGQQQAKLYADCLEAKFGQRPVIFYTNGYEHWIWDDATYPPRPVQGFYKKPELELLIQRRTSRKPLATAKIDTEIVERYYQTRAIRKIGESFEKDHARRTLLVMATGTGKTRTAIALVDLLQRANWVKRALFLADRIALVNQAVGAFKKHLPDAATVNLVTEKGGEGRVFASTYPTMMGLIDDTRNGGERRFGAGHFDLIIIDEAHRSIFQKYGAIFEYFDSLLVGLTATPVAEIDRNTYRLFELEDHVPTDAYTLDQAVADGFLVPARAVSVPVKFPTDGITYNDLSEEEREQFELTDWQDRADDVLERGHVEADAVNKWLFNKDTVDKVLKHLMERGQKVDGGDKLGKTILFAKNHKHATYIAERFNANYPQYRGDFARVIDFQTEYAQDLIDKFSIASRMPQLAISVDMLDTGIDVPEVVNLVFFKQVRSKTKFWQMVGRGTRLCPNLFGPGIDKEFFYIFDYCNNLEFFNQNIEATEGSAAASMSQRLFTARLQVLSLLSETKAGAKLIQEHAASYGNPGSDEEVFKSIIELLKAEVGAMNTDNFIVRAKRKLVEKYKDANEWVELDEHKLKELEDEIAGLPSEKEGEPIEAKQFDYLILRLQIATLEARPGFPKLRQQVQEFASELEELSTIPNVKAQLPLIEELQTDAWWEDVTVPMLEVVRLRLRKLANLIEPRKGHSVYTDFVDVIGDESEIALAGFAGATNFEAFKEKARAFLRKHLDREAIQKLRLNEPLDSKDLTELEQILAESGAGDQNAIRKAGEKGLGLFVRSLVGLDREAAKAAFNEFLNGKDLTSNQINFVNLIVDYLTEHGVMEPQRLYESPFTDINSQGPDGVFKAEAVDKIIQQLNQVREHALV